VRYLRGLPAAVRLHVTAFWFIADITREAVFDRIHHRTRPWPR
jgi:hypothetical protein